MATTAVLVRVGGELQSTQLVVEYTKLAVVPREITPGDRHDVIKYTDATIDVINGCLKIGAFAFPPAAPVLLAIAGVGSFIQTLMGFIPDNRPDPVVVKYKQLEEAIQKLDKQMNAHFSDLQSFITENHFNVEIRTEASTLMRFMRNCLKYQNKEDVQNFREAYSQNSPLDLAYRMSSFLENRTTNPLIMALANEKSKTKATFNKWKTTINGILGEFVFMEAFASGLMAENDTVDTYNRDRIVEQWNSIQEDLDKWEEEIGKDEGYWGEMKTYMEEFIPNATHLNNIQKGEEIKRKLDGFLTGDAFYICVFNLTKWNETYTYHCPNEKEQLIGVWGKGRCNAFIYRSRRGAKTNQKAYENLRGDIRQYVQYNLRWNKSLANLIKSQLLDKGIIRGYGFYCLMESGPCDPQIYYLNTPAPDWLNKGPGHLDYVIMDNDANRREFKFIVSFN